MDTDLWERPFEGDTVMNKEGYPNCFTASIKNRWHHC